MWLGVAISGFLLVFGCCCSCRDEVTAVDTRGMLALLWFSFTFIYLSTNAGSSGSTWAELLLSVIVFDTLCPFHGMERIRFGRATSMHFE